MSLGAIEVKLIEQKVVTHIQEQLVACEPRIAPEKAPGTEHVGSGGA
jgi:hypothetical protein